jgi:hypothetical protein
LIWSLYRDLKAYRQNPSRQRRTVLRARFDRIFTRKTGFVTLERPPVMRVSYQRSVHFPSTRRPMLESFFSPRGTHPPSMSG